MKVNIKQRNLDIGSQALLDKNKNVPNSNINSVSINKLKLHIPTNPIILKKQNKPVIFTGKNLVNFKCDIIYNMNIFSNKDICDSNNQYKNNDGGIKLTSHHIFSANIKINLTQSLLFINDKKYVIIKEVKDYEEISYNKCSSKLIKESCITDYKYLISILFLYYKKHLYYLALIINNKKILLIMDNAEDFYNLKRTLHMSIYKEDLGYIANYVRYDKAICTKKKISYDFNIYKNSINTKINNNRDSGCCIFSKGLLNFDCLSSSKNNHGHNNEDRSPRNIQKYNKGNLRKLSNKTKSSFHSDISNSRDSSNDSSDDNIARILYKNKHTNNASNEKNTNNININKINNSNNKYKDKIDIVEFNKINNDIISEIPVKLGYNNNSINISTDDYEDIINTTILVNNSTFLFNDKSLYETCNSNGGNIDINENNFLNDKNNKDKAISNFNIDGDSNNVYQKKKISDNLLLNKDLKLSNILNDNDLDYYNKKINANTNNHKISDTENNLVICKIKNIGNNETNADNKNNSHLLSINFKEKPIIIKNKISNSNKNTSAYKANNINDNNANAINNTLLRENIKELIPKTSIAYKEYKKEKSRIRKQSANLNYKKTINIGDFSSKNKDDNKLSYIHKHNSLIKGKEMEIKKKIIIDDISKNKNNKTWQLKLRIKEKI